MMQKPQGRCLGTVFQASSSEAHSRGVLLVRCSLQHPTPKRFSKSEDASEVGECGDLNKALPSDGCAASGKSLCISELVPSIVPLPPPLPTQPCHVAARIKWRRSAEIIPSTEMMDFPRRESITLFSLTGSVLQSKFIHT